MYNTPETHSMHRDAVHPTLGHPICGTSEFGENYKTTIPSSGWYMLLHEKLQAMDLLPLIPYVFVCVHTRFYKPETQ